MFSISGVPQIFNRILLRDTKLLTSLT